MASVSNEGIAAHYTRTGLLAAIEDGVAKLGKTPATVTVEDLAPVDEFHVGGRDASEAFLDQIGLTTSHRVLDIGCGLGGSARFAATRYGCHVTGIDLTEAFVTTGQELCDWVGLGGRVSLRQGSALATPFEADAFDGAYMLHVGMNIADKQQLCAEVYRVLRPGARFGIYDLMRTGDGTLQYPVPWASVPEHSALSTPSDYRSALEAAAFTIGAERSRREFALEFFASMKARTVAAGGPAALGLHLLMGDSAATKLTNVVGGIASGMLAPVELVAEKAL
jgi:ubiquinone/menaquinone biosynthesis C-methylase UbiE